MMVSGQDTPLNPAPAEISETISIDARDSNMHENAKESNKSQAKCCSSETKVKDVFARFSSIPE